MTEAVDPPGHRMRFDLLRRRGRILIIGAAFAAALGTLLATCARWWWVLDLFSHFRCHYAAALVIGTAFCLLAKRWWLAAVCGVFAAFNLAFIVPLYLPVAVPAATGRTVRLMLANVHVRNRDHQLFLQLVRDESPDIIVVMEVGSAWQQALDGLAGEYPYRDSRPREDAFGIAFLSRLRADAEVREIGPAEVPSIVAHIDCGESVAFNLVGTHPLPPVSAENVALRNAQLRDIGRFVGSLPRPTVLVGDLNTTSWSPVWRDLLVDSGLRDSRLGFGVQPTWPGRVATFGIPIDHVLVSTDLVVNERKIGPDIGSDHRPVILQLCVLP